GPRDHIAVQVDTDTGTAVQQNVIRIEAAGTLEAGALGRQACNRGEFANKAPGEVQHVNDDIDTHSAPGTIGGVEGAIVFPRMPVADVVSEVEKQSQKFAEAAAGGEFGDLAIERIVQVSATGCDQPVTRMCEPANAIDVLRRQRGRRLGE